MVRNNNCLPNGHFHKDWQKFVRTNFDQAFRKRRRQLQRIRKLKLRAPKPWDSLCPLVHCPSKRYHAKLRSGRGFTLAELKSANLSASFARTIGLRVDHRRRNKSHESLLLNNQRIKTYMSKLVLFPLSKKKQKNFSLPLKPLECKLQMNEAPRTVKTVKSRVPSEEEKKFNCYVTLRKARAEVKRRNRKLKQDKSKTGLLDEKK